MNPDAACTQLKFCAVGANEGGSGTQKLYETVRTKHSRMLTRFIRLFGPEGVKPERFVGLVIGQYLPTTIAAIPRPV